MITAIDLTKAIPPALLALPEVVSQVIPDLVEEARNEVVRLAHERLHSTAEDYINGLQPPVYHMPSGRLPEGEALVASVVLTGMLPNMLEHGWEGGDMKPALLAGRNAKTAEDGTRFNTVPFRHGTPGSAGRAGPPMGSPYAKSGAMTREAAKTMGRKVHRAAKKLAASTTQPGGGATKWGDRLPGGMSPKLRPHHKTDIHSGMVRMETTYDKKTDNKYMTFRRVSENSDPGSWMHPGIEPARIFDDAEDYVAKVATRLLRDAMHGMRSE